MQFHIWLTSIFSFCCSMTEPQPKYSAYREASFGHAIFDIKNRTHAYYSWHRNQDGYAVEADSMWFYNRIWHAVDESSKSASWCCVLAAISSSWEKLFLVLEGYFSPTFWFGILYLSSRQTHLLSFQIRYFCCI